MSRDAKYYGGFFWLAAISFIVPLFVGISAFKAAAPTTKPTPVLDASGVDHAVWDYLLKAYVSNGLVDYDGMKRDHLFREYLRELGAANPDALESDADRLALMCNAYNAFVINGVISHKISGSVTDFQPEVPDESYKGIWFFDVKEHIFAGKTISLNHLEHETIRPTFKEPRVHVALVCAARSCPSIRAEAFVGERIDQQLEDQSKQFANNSKYVNYNAETSKIDLSSILDWYGSDWDAKYPSGSYLSWIAGLTDNDELKTKLVAAISGEVEKNFLKYDWSLNSQGKPSSGHSSGEFGSGSIQTE